MADASDGPLVWEGVAVTYRGAAPVSALRPTSLRIEVGAHVAVTGPSGSGKSTLLNVLGLLDLPTSGSYELGGRDVARLPEGERAALRARWFGFVFQQFHLVPALSASENVELSLMYGGTPRRRRAAAAAEALQRVGLGARAAHRPAELSGGEQQRVAIARGIVGGQRFLLADEPTGSLDSATAAGVLDLLDGLVADGRGVVCVTHDERVAERAARRLEVLDGLVTTDAPVAGHARTR